MKCGQYIHLHPSRETYISPCCSCRVCSACLDAHYRRLHGGAGYFDLQSCPACRKEIRREHFRKIRDDDFLIANELAARKKFQDQFPLTRAAFLFDEERYASWRDLRERLIAAELAQSGSIDAELASLAAQHRPFLRIRLARDSPPLAFEQELRAAIQPAISVGLTDVTAVDPAGIPEAQRRLLDLVSEAVLPARQPVTPQLIARIAAGAQSALQAFDAREKARQQFAREAQRLSQWMTPAENCSWSEFLRDDFAPPPARPKTDRGLGADRIEVLPDADSVVRSVKVEDDLSGFGFGARARSGVALGAATMTSAAAQQQQEEVNATFRLVEKTRTAMTVSQTNTALRRVEHKLNMHTPKPKGIAPRLKVAALQRATAAAAAKPPVPGAAAPSAVTTGFDQAAGTAFEDEDMGNLDDW
jgi:hypothetical protein